GQRGGRLARTAPTSSGKYRVSGRSLRLPSSTSSPSRKTRQRKPSHFGSYRKSPSGIWPTGLASIGRTGGNNGRSIAYPSDVHGLACRPRGVNPEPATVATGWHLCPVYVNKCAIRSQWGCAGTRRIRLGRGGCELAARG